MNAIGQVWLAGATGLVGQQTLGSLLADEGVAHVLAAVRRTALVPHPKLSEKVVDFEVLEQALSGLTCAVAICCLGSTIKQAGSQTQFRHIDHDYVLAFARAAKRAGAQHFLVVTALGADPQSRIFYNRVKGEVEQGLFALGFARLTIARPSLLIGERTNARLGERLLGPLSRLLPKSVSGIDARTVGRALVRLAHESTAAHRIVLSKELHALGA